MKLKIRYDENETFVEVPIDSNLYLTVGLVPDEEAGEQAEADRIQEAFDKLFNKPDYNNWHKHNRHIGSSIAKPNEDGDEIDMSEPLMSEVIDPEIFYSQERQIERQMEYEETCKKIRTILAKKPYWAEAFIAVRIDGMSVNDYADYIGAGDASTISKRLARAEKKLKDEYDY